MWGSITSEDEKGVMLAVEKANYIEGPILEIGALFGFTTQLIASYKKTEKKLITVENFSWNPFYLSATDHRIFINRVLRYCIENLKTEIYDGSNKEFYSSYKGKRPSMIFIDAEHTYEGIIPDLEWSIRMNIPIISGHDYHELFPGVIKAVDKIFGDKIEVFGSVWVVGL